MYEKIKTTLTSYPKYYYVIGVVVFVALLCIGYIFIEPNRGDYNDTLNTVERVEKQQRESLELNRSIQRSIDRSTELSHEAKERVDRSTQYNQQIGKRIDESQTSINEARGYLVRNAELFDRVERENRERQENNKAVTDAAQPIPNTGGWSGNRSSNSSMTER